MALSIFLLDLLVLVASLTAFFAIRDFQRRGGIPYPPGPPPLPLIGNLFDIPKEFAWLQFSALAKKYGDVISFRVFGQVIVVLNTSKATKELFEKRGEIYSDRPTVPFHEMMGWQWNVTLARYTDDWRQARKLLDRGLRPGAIAAYRPLQETKARVLLTQLLENPNEWEAHLGYLLGTVIMGMGYGYEVQGRNDRKIDVARKMARLGADTVLPGALLVNDLPFLRHIPEWLPWFSYKPLARYGYDIGQEVLHAPMAFVKEGILNGTAQPSLALEGLQEMENLKGQEREKADEALAGALASMYAAGTDTVHSVFIMSFFVAVLLHPAIQKIAQQELDMVTKRERLPTFEDRPALPFVDAICKEVLRWRPVVPLAVPHATTKDDVYEGLFIPKGTMVFGNVWAMFHDPEMYPEPDSFIPGRFLNADGSLREDPLLMSAFGFGKRICPGRHVVDGTFFIIIASLLSVFNIEKGQDADGGPEGFTYIGGAISRPHSFRCSIIPRDKRAEELIVADSLTR
ncbi:cytochrome P450 [Russula earlei]|uniref:Cytochrome P450 n=1 Tax=Russula earlei TaxID=71964 RepID=A0ACC0U175_9AGAM|nr:cytochrome P450 [Russula earlei]